MLEALANRAAWVAGNRDVPEPGTRPVETFEGGTVTYVFRASTAVADEISAMYVDPPDEADDVTGETPGDPRPTGPIPAGPSAALIGVAAT